MGIDQKDEAGAKRVRRAHQIAQIHGLLMPAAPIPKYPRIEFDRRQ
jgi:hypothetical protein